MRKALTLTCLLILGAGSAQVVAQDVYRLVSAQVVAHSEQAPMLKLIATGPIAFHVLTESESGVPASPDRFVARLYGVAPGDMTTAGLYPFAVSISVVGQDSLVTIAAAGLPPTATLALRAGMRSNELQVLIVAQP